MSGPLPNSLREKFKLLRQWQMQQQDDFLKKQIRYKQNQLLTIETMSPNVRHTSNTVGNETDHEKDHLIMEDESIEEEPLSKNLPFLQRMSPNSLQTALSDALIDIARSDEDNEDEKKTCNNEADSVPEDIVDSDEYPKENFVNDDNNGIDCFNDNKSCGSDDDDYTNSDNLWNRSEMLQTVVFNPKSFPDKKSQAEEPLSPASSILGSGSDVDEGVYPIVYSEDNVSENEENQIDNRENNEYQDVISVPFDEIPAQSKLGTAVTSFEALVEKQLHTASKKKSPVQKQINSGNNKKPFLRKGEGIARFKGYSNARHITKQNPGKTNSVSSAAVSLPKTSLKLVPKPMLRTSHPPKVDREDVKNRLINTSPDSSIETSFQKMLLKSNANDKIDDEELKEFELLEEAAENTSLSSDASIVVQMMCKATSKSAQNSTSSPMSKTMYYPQHAKRNALSVNMESLDEESLENSPNAGLSSSTALIVDRLEGLPKDNIGDMPTEDVEFLDQSAWADTTLQSQDESDLTMTESPKVDSRKVLSSPQKIGSPPPTSNLMKHLFPNLKEKTVPREIENEKKNEQRNVIENTRPPTFDSQLPGQNSSDVMKTKLSELESEISKFKQENNNLEKLKIEREKELSKLRTEVERFQKQRSDELERIEKFKDEEARKIKRERKLFEKYQKEARTIPNKKDRDEIEALKQQLEELQDEVKRRETRWNGSAARFRKRIEDLENENHQLKENLKIVEKERLQRWSEQKNNTPEDNGEVKRVEHNPRLDVVPEEHPPSPSCVSSVYFRSNSISLLTLKTRKDSNSVAPPTQRLSVTPEKPVASQEKQDLINTQTRYSDGKVERILSNGSREITFPNGTIKTIDPTNQNVVVSFFNGDMKQILADERVVYYYAESKTTHTTCKDGLEMFEFSNGQVEKHYPNGRKEIIYPDKTVKCIFVNGAEETVFADGTIQNLEINGDRTISFPNGQREIHTQQYKRREYPDGTSKTVYQDGKQETRYASGRLRIKDPQGNILVDTGTS
eukprot:gene14387-15884_t